MKEKDLDFLDKLIQHHRYGKDKPQPTAMPSGHMIYGFDLGTADALVMPIREELKFFDDSKVHEPVMQGFYGTQEVVLGHIDSRVTAMGIINRAEKEEEKEEKEEKEE